MHARSVIFWLLTSYFAPFIAFFFGTFWLGLNIWMFIMGTFVVSFMMLFLFLAFKKWQIQWESTLEFHKEQVRTPPPVKIYKEPELPTFWKSAITMAPPSNLALISKEHQQRLESAYSQLQDEHEKIVLSYEHERNRLFEEFRQKDAGSQTKSKEIERLAAQVASLEQAIKEKELTIQNLKFELHTLLQMDQELLALSVNEERFLK